jgi:hypothetical protein
MYIGIPLIFSYLTKFCVLENAHALHLLICTHLDAFIVLFKNDIMLVDHLNNKLNAKFNGLILIDLRSRLYIVNK